MAKHIKKLKRYVVTQFGIEKITIIVDTAAVGKCPKTGTEYGEHSRCPDSTYVMYKCIYDSDAYNNATGNAWEFSHHDKILYMSDNIGDIIKRYPEIIVS